MKPFVPKMMKFELIQMMGFGDLNQDLQIDFLNVQVLFLGSKLIIILIIIWIIMNKSKEKKKIILSQFLEELK